MKPYATAATIAEQGQDWLKQVAPYNRAHLALNTRVSALLVVDMQQFFLDPASPTYTAGGPAVLPGVKRLLEAFRSAGRPVIYTRHVHAADGSDVGIMGWWWEGMCVEGTPASAIAPELAPLPAEKVIAKHRYSAFYNTDLETVLRVLKVEDLVICGIMTNMCVESTARDAYFRDYRVFIPADGTGSITEEMHRASLLNLAYGFAVISDVAALCTAAAGDASAVAG